MENGHTETITDEAHLADMYGDDKKQRRVRVDLNHVAGVIMVSSGLLYGGPPEDFNRPHNGHRFPTAFRVKEPEVASVQTPEPAPQRTLAAFAAKVNNRCCCCGCTGEEDAVHPHQREPLLHHSGTRPVAAIIPEPWLHPHAPTLQAPAARLL